MNQEKCGRHKADLCMAMVRFEGMMDMKKRILAYLEHIDNLLKEDENEQGLDYDLLILEHLQQIQFFMHEREVHLWVTLAFAILSFSVFGMIVFSFQPGLVLLFAAFLVLLIPYIMHYYLLENGVQKMYQQYDEMLRRKNRKAGRNERESFTVSG